MATPSHLARFPNNPSRFPATLDKLERLLAHNRGAKIVWAHGGSDQLGPMTPERIGALMDRHSNLFVSLRVVGPNTPDENKLIVAPPPRVPSAWLTVLERHSDRFVIGAEGFHGGPIDQFIRTTEARLKFSAVLLSLLPRDLARKIGYENAVRVYRLPAVDGGVAGSTGGAPNASAPPAKQGGTCRDGNMDHCRQMCQRGVKRACNRMK